MLKAPAVAESSGLSSRQDQFGLVFVVAYQILALVAFAAIPILANRWIRTPFLGGFVEHTLMFNEIAPPDHADWSAFQLGLGFDDQLVAIEGRQVRTAAGLTRELGDYRPGDVVTLTLRSPEGDLRTQEIRLTGFSRADQIAFFHIPYFLGLIYLGSGLWVLSLRRQDAAGRAFALFATAVALTLAGLFDLYTTHRLTALWTVSLALAGGALFNLALVFPQEVSVVGRFPFLRWLGYVPAGLLAARGLTRLYALDRPTAYALAWRDEYLFLATGALFFLGWMAVRRFTSRSPIARAQARLILWGSLLAFGPMIGWLVGQAVRPGTVFNPYLLLPLAIFPTVTAYTILRYRLLKTDYILSRAVFYALLTVLAAAAYALLVGGLSLLFATSVENATPFAIGLMVIALALVLNPLRTRLQGTMDNLFFRGQQAYRERLQAFTHQLTQTVDLPQIIQHLYQYIDESLLPTQLHVFVHDSLSDQYVAAPTADGHASSDVRFSANSALVQTLSQRESPFFMDRSVTMPRALHSDWARMALLGVQLFLPLPGQQQLAGWLALGPRRSGEPYTDRDLAYLEALSDQAALAIERAKVVADLERRVHETSVLTRVAQGVNITLAFDDILELIYAQTNQVLPLHDLRITLHNKATDSYYHAFYLENHDRLRDRENKPLGERHGLAPEVCRTGRVLITEDYARECRHRAALPLTHGLYAWMGIPLNTGAETIGTLSLGSRDPAVLYTDEQRDFLQTIADQAAGAIAKARLLEESERRARQLATLNDVARSLASTLELDPLLNRILKSAVDILSCEAGSLFLVDEETGELVFKVTVGPVAGDLIGQRLPPGTGLVGKAVDTGQPVIANDVHRSTEWFDETDQQTGFITRAILVVPMQVKDRTIGVIEVINKRDGLPFTEDDQELLTVFTGQAAVAIENARLYTLTDQALADRVDELSVMQRIDRELNTSLDMSNAMRITLDWAIRQSDSTAGFVGSVVDGEVHVQTSQGYQDGSDEVPDTISVGGLPALQTAIESGVPETSAGGASLLIEASARAAIPIRRETDVIGILYLESAAPDRYNEETLSFLSRLSDHAAIAISNAQLYREVQEANIAKSDFVSFVSHELKTPMTSIKGYADLLANEAVGPVSEAQANFLSTIRSNVNRMATLVSDLADISRIEAGRLRLEFQAVRASDMVEEVVRSAQSQIDEKGHDLRVEIPPDLPEVWADPTRLTQILTNLVSNANKYTPPGGQITIRCRPSRNRWDPAGAPEVVHISVTDTGIGISPADQKKIFQKFFRSEDQKAREAPGTGLGLNITKNLVEMQGGKIWFESVYRKGTTFHFTVPVVESA